MHINTLQYVFLVGGRGERLGSLTKNIEGTQKIFNQRAKMNTLAAQGKWSKELEN